MKARKHTSFGTIMLCLAIAGCNSNYKINQQDSVSQTTVKQKHDNITPQVKIKTTINEAKEDSTVKLSDGFEMQINVGEPREVNNLKLFHNGRNIDLGTKDSSGYVMDDKLYPMINKLDANAFELFIEEANNPNKNLLIYFLIKNDRVVVKKVFPTFIAKPSDLDGDGVLEVAGQWDNSEEWDENGKRYRTVDPILYYKLTKQGIKLDSALTIKQNTMIYGKFYGFKFDGKTGVDVKLGCNERSEKEYERIIAKAN